MCAGADRQHLPGGLPGVRAELPALLVHAHLLARPGHLHQCDRRPARSRHQRDRGRVNRRLCGRRLWRALLQLVQGACCCILCTAAGLLMLQRLQETH